MQVRRTPAPHIPSRREGVVSPNGPDHGRWSAGPGRGTEPSGRRSQPVAPSKARCCCPCLLRGEAGCVCPWRAGPGHVTRGLVAPIVLRCARAVLQLWGGSSAVAIRRCLRNLTLALPAPRDERPNWHWAAGQVGVPIVACPIMATSGPRLAPDVRGCCCTLDPADHAGKTKCLIEAGIAL